MAKLAQILCCKWPNQHPPTDFIHDGKFRFALGIESLNKIAEQKRSTNDTITIHQQSTAGSVQRSTFGQRRLQLSVSLAPRAILFVWAVRVCERVACVRALLCAVSGYALLYVRTFNSSAVEMQHQQIQGIRAHTHKRSSTTKQNTAR